MVGLGCWVAGLPKLRLIISPMWSDIGKTELLYIFGITTVCGGKLHSLESVIVKKQSVSKGLSVAKTL